ncbi:MAG: hypothetical protein KatS3mg115_2094 [Candidatus Poribacteria bacterium]|nr:MAG: hypothetical protein KatS3mg115_2094 [Candidatus Poribacteria bacterium]
MRTLLSFLGKGPYQEVTYVWREDGKEEQVTTDLFPKAAASFFQPDRILIAVTEEVRTGENFRRLQEQLSSFEPLLIPEGRSEADLWELFERIAEAIGNGERLVLDVTHSFRRCP